MSNALAHRDELNFATATFDKSVSDIRDDVIHSIVNMVVRLNKRGESWSIHFEKDFLRICRFKKNEDAEFIKPQGRIDLASTAQLIDALEHLEQLESEAFIDDTAMLFTKEDKPDAEIV